MAYKSYFTSFFNCLLGSTLCLFTMTAQTQASTSAQMVTTPTASFLNIEAPFRCSVKEVGSIDISTTIALKDKDFKLNYIDEMDALPRYEVNGFTFDSMPLDEALQNLLREAEIDVYTEDTAYPELSGKSIFGELSTVVKELSTSADAFAKYDADQKRLYLSHRGRFELQLPDNRIVMFAVLDALRGAGITGMIPNWKNHTVLMILTHAEQQKVQELLDYILKDGKLLLADIQVYRLHPLHKDANWQSVVANFGAGRIHTAQDGLVGKMLTMGHQKRFEHLRDSLLPNYDVNLISQGVAIVPNGWKMRFDIGKCAFKEEDLSSLSILLNAQIKSSDYIETAVTIDTAQGEITTFNTIDELDNEIAVIGVPAFPTQEGSLEEMLFTLKLRFIRFTKEGK